MRKAYYQFQRLIDERMPLSSVVRWFIVAGISLRYSLISDEYSASIREVWLISLYVYSIYSSGVSIVDFYQFRHPWVPIRPAWYVFQIAIDTAAFTCFYVLTGRSSSDFYLFYLLPLLITAEHFRGEKIAIILAIITICFLAAFIAINRLNPSGPTLTTSLINDALPRIFFFFLIILLIFIRGNVLREKTDELEAVQKTAVGISKNKTIEERLEAILDAAVGLLEAKGSKLYLYSPRDETLKLVALHGLSSEFFKEGYRLKPTDGMVGKVFQQKHLEIVNDYKTYPYRIPELEDLFESVIEVPLFVDSIEPIGVLGVFDTARHTFSERDAFILQRLAQYAAIAIRDSQLVEQAQKQSNVLTTLYDASNALIDAAFDVDEALNAIVEQACKLSVVFNSTPPILTYFVLYNNENGSLEFKSTYPRDQLLDLRNRIGNVSINLKPIGVVGRAIATGQNQNVPDVTVDGDYIPYHLSTRSQLTVLAKGKSGVIGIISIEHPDFNAFPRELEDQMEVLAAQAASAIENAYLFEKIRLGRTQAENLRQAAIKISSYTDINDVGNMILETLRILIPFDRATLQRIDENDGHFREIVAKYNLSEDNVDRNLLRPVSADNLVRKIVAAKSTLIIPSTKAEPDWETLSTTSDIQSWAGIPLVYGERVVGLITLDNVGQQAYAFENKQLLDLFSSHAAGVFQNAILFRRLAEHVEELTQTKEHLEALLDYYEEYQNLALIGLVFGETIHYASNQLGMAKTIMKNIQVGDYTDRPTITQKAERAVKYINDYFDVLKEVQEKAIHSPTILPVNVQMLLDKIIGSKRISPDISVRTIFNAINPIVKAPERQLRQVFYVIIQNALDAMPRGSGVLELGTETRDTDSGEYLLVSVSDTGRGIGSDQEEELFTAKIKRDTRKGIGIGLAWARSFIRSYGGDVYFRSRQGQGTTMFIRIPRDFGDRPRIQKRGKFS